MLCEFQHINLLSPDLFQLFVLPMTKVHLYLKAKTILGPLQIGVEISRQATKQTLKVVQASSGNSDLLSRLIDCLT